MSEIEPAKSDAAAAFEALRGEVALMRRAVEALASERCDTPNYGPSLEALSARQQALVDAVRKLASAAALVMTPDEVVRKLADGTTAVNAVHAQTLQEALAKLESLSQQLGLRAKSVREADAQRDWVVGSSVAGFILGAASIMLLIRVF